jgi:hypothetical protein
MWISRWKISRQARLSTGISFQGNILLFSEESRPMSIFLHRRDALKPARRFVYPSLDIIQNTGGPHGVFKQLSLP